MKQERLASPLEFYVDLPMRNARFKTILIITPYLPYPNVPHAGGKAIYDFIVHLKQRGLRVCLASLVLPEEIPLPERFKSTSADSVPRARPMWRKSSNVWLYSSKRLSVAGLNHAELPRNARESPPCITARRGGCVIKKMSRSHRR